jgi:DNA-directed RNA polymerase subunit RPC12/RpoP
MSSSTKHVNKKAVKVFQFWFCERCQSRIEIEKAPALDLELHRDDPNDLARVVDNFGLKIVCKKCGHDKFVKKEFEIPLQDMVEKELAKQVKEYTTNNQNPTRRI